MNHFHCATDEVVNWYAGCSIWFQAFSSFLVDLLDSGDFWLARGNPSGKPPRVASASAAPRCDVTASQHDAIQNRANQPGFCFSPESDPPKADY
jgi:hypothetical protein